MSDHWVLATFRWSQIVLALAVLVFADTVVESVFAIIPLISWCLCALVDVREEQKERKGDVH